MHKYANVCESMQTNIRLDYASFPKKNTDVCKIEHIIKVFVVARIKENDLILCLLQNRFILYKVLNNDILNIKAHKIKP